MGYGANAAVNAGLPFRLSRKLANATRRLGHSATVRSVLTQPASRRSRREPCRPPWVCMVSWRCRPRSTCPSPNTCRQSVQRRRVIGDHGARNAERCQTSRINPNSSVASAFSLQNTRKAGRDLFDRACSSRTIVLELGSTAKTARVVILKNKGGGECERPRISGRVRTHRVIATRGPAHPSGPEIMTRPLSPTCGNSFAPQPGLFGTDRTTTRPIGTALSIARPKAGTSPSRCPLHLPRVYCACRDVVPEKSRLVPMLRPKECVLSRGSQLPCSLGGMPRSRPPQAARPEGGKARGIDRSGERITAAAPQGQIGSLASGRQTSCRMLRWLNMIERNPPRAPLFHADQCQTPLRIDLNHSRVFRLRIAVHRVWMRRRPTLQPNHLATVKLWFRRVF